MSYKNTIPKHNNIKPKLRNAIDYQIIDVVQSYLDRFIKGNMGINRGTFRCLIQTKNGTIANMFIDYLRKMVKKRGSSYVNDIVQCYKKRNLVVLSSDMYLYNTIKAHDCLNRELIHGMGLYNAANIVLSLVESKSIIVNRQTGLCEYHSPIPQLIFLHKYIGKYTDKHVLSATSQLVHIIYLML